MYIIVSGSAEELMSVVTNMMDNGRKPIGGVAPYHNVTSPDGKYVFAQAMIKEDNKQQNETSDKDGGSDTD